MEKVYKKQKKKFDWSKFKIDLKTNLLMMLPMGLYIWILKTKTKNRMKDYVGVLGNNPIAYPVHYGVILVDLNNMQL